MTKIADVLELIILILVLGLVLWFFVVNSPEILEVIEFIAWRVRVEACYAANNGLFLCQWVQ